MAPAPQQRALSKPTDQQRYFKTVLESDQFQKALRTTLPRHIRPDRMIRVVLAAMQQSPKLLECTPDSVLLSVMRAAAHGLEPDGGALGHGYLVPYWNGKKSCYECQFIPGYRGLVKLARNSGEVADVWAEVVYEADEFSYELGIDQKLSHKRNDDVDDPGPLKYVYAVARFTDGTKKFTVMNRREIEAIKRRSSSKNKAGEIVGPWATDEAEMWRKTAVRRLAKYLPLSAETPIMLADDGENGSTVGEMFVVPKLPKQERIAESKRGREVEEPHDQESADESQTEDEQVAGGDVNESAEQPDATENSEPGVSDALAEANDRFTACTDLASVNATQREMEAVDESDSWRANIASMADEARDRIRATRGSRANGR